MVRDERIFLLRNEHLNVFAVQTGEGGVSERYAEERFCAGKHSGLIAAGRIHSS
jgi:hypothetical protein